jgi:flagellin-like protein
MYRKLQKKMDEEGVSPVIAIILMVAITVVLAGVLYVWVTSLANTDAGVTTLNLSATVTVDEQNGNVNITLEHRGGSKMTLNEYRFQFGSTTLTTANAHGSTNATATTVEVGQTIFWHIADATATIGGAYAIKVINVPNRRDQCHGQQDQRPDHERDPQQG